MSAIPLVEQRGPETVDLDRVVAINPLRELLAEPVFDELAEFPVLPLGGFHLPWYVTDRLTMNLPEGNYVLVPVEFFAKRTVGKAQTA